jgi:hypothetical protein
LADCQAITGVPPPAGTSTATAAAFVARILALR